MRVVFAGTPEFAGIALQAIVQAGHDVVAVLTQPDRPSGRGMKLQSSAVKQLAIRLGLPVWQPGSLKDPVIQTDLAGLNMDVMVVAAYGQLLPQVVLDMPRLGCLNIHASLLPRWRGAAPIHRAIAAGDRQTGICIMQMDAGLDTGAICASVATPILPEDTTGRLHDRLAQLGGELIVTSLAQAMEGRLTCIAQPVDGVTYAAKISRADARIDWQQPAAVLQRLVRALDPAPGAYALWHDQPLKCWEAAVVDGDGVPGQIMRADANGIVVACGERALQITQLQAAGGKRLSAAQLLSGHSLSVGDRLA